MDWESQRYNENDILVFEGEYLNGKRWFGKLYDKKGYLKFDGQFQLNGEKLNGIGREYYSFGKLFLNVNI